MWTASGTPSRPGPGTASRPRQIEQRFKDELNLQRQGISQPQPEMTFGGTRCPLPCRRRTPSLSRRPIEGALAVLRARPQSVGSPKPMAIATTAANDTPKSSVTETTVNRDLEALRHMLFWAVDEGLLAANPLSRVRMARERRKPRFVVSLAEEELLLLAAAPHLRSIIIAALDTGMRRGEILTQRWEHIDFTRRLLSVTHSKTPEGEAREIPLTGTSLRAAPRTAADRKAWSSPTKASQSTGSRPPGRPQSAGPEFATSASTICATPSTPDSWKPASCRKSARPSWATQAVRT